MMTNVLKVKACILSLEVDADSLSGFDPKGKKLVRIQILFPLNNFTENMQRNSYQAC